MHVSVVKRVYLGCDHAGFELKEHLKTHLAGRYEVVDCGPATFDPDDDYPAFCIEAAQRVVADPHSLGVVIGGSGNGEQIAANKVDGARAALAYNQEIAALARQHNNANVVGIGARMHSVVEATAIVETFLTAAFSGEPRHERRIQQLAEYERDGTV